MSEQKTDKPKTLEKLLQLAKPSADFEALATHLHSSQCIVDRLKATFDFMRLIIARGFGPRRAEFWQAKQICLAFFKENMDPAFRYPLWQQFTEILSAAELANEMLAESSAFYFEQLHLALTDLDKQVSAEDAALSSSFSLMDKLGFDGTCQAMEEFLQGLAEELTSLQGRLEHFRQFAVRYRSLREEIVERQLKAGDKRALFDELHQLKEKIFPIKRALTEKIDDLFDEEVSQFIANALCCGEPSKPIYLLKQQLKALQQLAKELSLSSKGFKNSRLKLSELWDLLTTLEDAQREKMREQRAQCVLNAAAVSEKIELLKSELPSLGIDLLISKTKQVTRFMHGLHLLREDKKRLREELEALKASLLASEAGRRRRGAPEAKEQQAADGGCAFADLIGQIEALDPNDERGRLAAEECAGRLELTSGQLSEVKMCLADLERKRREALKDRLESEGDAEALARFQKEERLKLQHKLEELKRERARANLGFERGLALEEEISSLKTQLEG